ncbi:SMI1/KNR4 family protein [Herpetosiphon llansteffanensis]|uniref:SMI1/KNR4 family protein n=1 Tax=Herpetosiphon llansteffanensis TaxID=2094568 RepID=UPI000D7C58B8|nr:SMI1/KNR4 family protein [Herpetosiphon llansteffanensis]
MDARAVELWHRMLDWLSLNYPECLQYRHEPVDQAQIAAAEAMIGLELPAAFATTYLLNSHHGGIPICCYPEYQWLSLAECVESWQWSRDNATPRENDLSENGPVWHKLVAEERVWIEGPIKLGINSELRIPFMSSDGGGYLYLDFDPAPGGVKGQVISIDPEGCTWLVLAPSFEQWLETFVTHLEQGHIQIGEYGLEHIEQAPANKQPMLMPEYLRNIRIESYQAAPIDPAALQALAFDQEIAVTGRMRSIMGNGSDIVIFDFDIDGMSERQKIGAYAAQTYGFGTIQCGNYAHLWLVRYNQQIPNIEYYTKDSVVQWFVVSYTLTQ